MLLNTYTECDIERFVPGRFFLFFCDIIHASNCKNVRTFPKESLEYSISQKSVPARQKKIAEVQKYFLQSLGPMVNKYLTKFMANFLLSKFFIR